MTMIATAQTEYYRRPADERMESPEALVAFTAARKASCREVSWNAKDLRAVPVDDTRVQLQSPRGVADLTPWSHAQLCKMVGAPGAYLRTLPAPLAAQNLNHGLQATPAGTTVSILGQLSGGSVTARSVNSETYGRLWDSDLYGPVVDSFCAQGWTVPPTWDGKPAGAYTSDRDSFLILVNGGSMVNDPSVSGGKGEMYRGIMLSNSEVGRGSAVFERVLFERVCGNHALWGAVIDRTFRRRHVGTRVLRDVLREVGNAARTWLNRPASADEAIIRSLMSLELAATREAVIDELAAMGATKADAEAAYVACEEQFDASPRSFWGLSQGLTKVSQASGHQDSRMELDLFAGKLVARGARQLQLA